MARVPGKLTNISLQQKQRLAFRDWARYTHEDLLKGIDKERVKDTGVLKASVRHRLTGVRGGRMEAEFTYLTYGMFVDMGVYGKLRRNPRFWYSRAMRSNQLRLGQIMLNMSYSGFPRLFEEIITKVKI